MQAEGAGNCVPSKHRGGGSVDLGEDAEFKRPPPPSLTKQQGDASIERFRIPSMAPSQARISRSHSYPQDASSPRKVNLVDRATNVRSTDSVASPSSIPPFVSAGTRVKDQYPGPSVRPRLAERPAMRRPATSHVTRPQQVSRQIEVMNDSDMDGEQQTSSDLGMVIQQCNHTFQEQRRAVEPPRRRSTASRTINMGHKYDRPSATHQARRRPVVRFSEVELPLPRLPNFPGPSIYEQQVYHRRNHSQIKLDDNTLLDNSYVAEQELAEGDDEMLYDNENWEEHFEVPAYYEEKETGMVEDEYEMGESHALNNTVQHRTSDNGVVAPGFWRPNRLY
jgi:hypothetical protein